jgi:hypothetical protein
MEIDQTLDQIEARLFEATRLAKQPTLGRRAAPPAAVCLVKIVISQLREVLGRHPEVERGWRLLSRAEEVLLNPENARFALERAITLSGRRSKHDLKKLYFLEQSAREWFELGLKPEELESLGHYLEDMVGNGPFYHDLRWTSSWLESHFTDKAQEILAALRSRGGNTDLQVLHNIVRGG